MLLRIQTHQVHSFLSTSCNVFTSKLESLRKIKWFRSWVNIVITLRLSSKLFTQKYCYIPRGYPYCLEVFQGFGTVLLLLNKDSDTRESSCILQPTPRK